MQQIQQAGGIIINPAGHIVLVTNSNGSHTFPKGAQEKNETLQQTAAREIQEETGLTDVIIGEKLGVVERRGYTATNHRTPTVIKVVHVYSCTSQTTAALTPLVSDIRAARWVAPMQVADQLTYLEDRDFFLSVQSLLPLR